MSIQTKTTLEVEVTLRGGYSPGEPEVRDGPMAHPAEPESAWVESVHLRLHGSETDGFFIELPAALWEDCRGDFDDAIREAALAEAADAAMEGAVAREAAGE